MEVQTVTNIKKQEEEQKELFIKLILFVAQNWQLNNKQEKVVFPKFFINYFGKEPFDVFAKDVSTFREDLKEAPKSAGKNKLSYFLLDRDDYLRDYELFSKNSVDLLVNIASTLFGCQGDEQWLRNLRKQLILSVQLFFYLRTICRVHKWSDSKHTCSFSALSDTSLLAERLLGLCDEEVYVHLKAIGNSLGNAYTSEMLLLNRVNILFDTLTLVDDCYKEQKFVLIFEVTNNFPKHLKI